MEWHHTENKIVVFGTGSLSQNFAEENIQHISYFINNDLQKHGEKLFDKPIHSPEQLFLEDKNQIVIVIASFFYKEIAEQLEKMEFIEGIHFFNAPQTIYTISNYTPWNYDNKFEKVYNKIKKNTLVDQLRCFELWGLVEQVESLQGAIIEIGVWRGGTGALIAKRAELCGITDTVYLCDTFEGVVKAGEKDSHYKGGEHSDTSVNTVRELLQVLNVKNYKLLEGIFPDKTSLEVTDTIFRLCHIDVDVYESARDIIEWIWDKLVVGGVIIFDDYGFAGCEGITTYVNELKNRNDLIFVHNINGHAILIKIK